MQPIGQSFHFSCGGAFAIAFADARKAMGGSGYQEGAGAAGGVQQQYVSVGYAFGAKMVLQGPVRGIHHEAHDRNGGEEYPMFFAGFRVKDRKEILIKVKDGVPAILWCQHGRVEDIDGVAQDIEGSAKGRKDFILRQGTKGGAEQRKTADWQAAIGAFIHFLCPSFPRQKQPEG